MTYLKGKEGREFLPCFSNIPPEAIPIRSTRSGRKPTETCIIIFGCNDLSPKVTFHNHKSLKPLTNKKFTEE